MNLLLLVSLVAADARPAFLDISPFSRATALGGAFSAVRNDPSGLFWNPATPGPSALHFALADWLVDTRLAAGAGAYDLRGIGTIQAGLSYLAYGNMTRWDEEGNPIGSFSAYDLLAKLGYRREFAGFLTAGAGLGLIGEKVDNWTRNRFALDAGLTARRSFLTAGLVVRDVMFSGGPFVKCLGLAANPFEPLLLSAELRHVERLEFRGGAELELGSIALRGGFDGRSPCFGAGFRLRGVTVDYASVLHRNLGLVHQLTLGIGR